MIFSEPSCVELDCDSPEIITYDYDYGMFQCAFKYLYGMNCGCIFLANTPSPGDVHKIYPDTYGAYSTDGFGFFGGMARGVAAHLKKRELLGLNKSFESIIEFGCGANPLATLLKSKSNKVVLCDVSDVTCNKADEFIRGNIEDVILTLEAQSYDLVILNQVIEHLSDPFKFISAVFKILRPGGIFFIETPNINGYEAKLSIDDGTWGGFHAPRHFVLFSDTSLPSVLSNSGFYILSVDSIYNPFLLNNTIRNKLIKWLGKDSILLTFFTMRNPLTLFFYFILDTLAITTRKRTGNMRVIAQRRIGSELG